MSGLTSSRQSGPLLSIFHGRFCKTPRVLPVFQFCRPRFLPVPRSLSTLLLLALIASTMPSQPAHAQDLSPARWFIEGYGQANLYEGDRILSNAAGPLSRLGSGVGLTLGYDLTSRMAATARVMTGTYPGVDYNVLEELVRDRESTDRRTAFHVSTRARLFPIWKFRTFASGGLGIVSGRINDEQLTGWGPSFGGGATVNLFGLPFFGRMDVLVPFHDYVLDAARTGSQSDVAFSMSAGIRYRHQPRPPVFEDIVITAPSMVRVGEDAVFTVSGSLDPAAFNATWDLGDGTTVNTASTVHRYMAPGAYSVSVTAGNARTTIERQMTVRVIPTYQPIEIVTLAVSPRSPRVDDEVTMNPVLRGDVDSCEWTFGDGGTASDCDTSHAFRAPGTYRLELRIRNADHSALAVQLLNIRTNACQDVPALHSVFFRPGSSELSLAMRTLLRENASSMGTCPGQPLDVQGVALHAEGGAALAEARAEAVIQYYTNLGLASDRIRRPPVQVLPDGSDIPEQSRRVDSYLVIEDE